MDNVRLKQMYEAYSKDIFNLAFHCSGSRQEAEDIVQDVFIKYSQKMDVVDIKNPKYWLMKVATNLCIDKKRHFKTALTSLLDIFNFSSKSSSFEKDVVLSDEVKKILNSVDKKTRVAIILKYMEEMDYKEISELMGIKAGTLKSMVSRGVSKIKERGGSHE